MPVSRVNISVQTKGAIFDASRTQAAGKRFTTRMNTVLAEEGVRRVKARLDQVLKRPTGFYKSNITTDRRSQFRGITDSGVVYGGWLEGVDSRNRTTRFKGYRTFRIVKQSLNRDSDNIVRSLVDAYVQELSR